jgi:hypothetical protein
MENHSSIKKINNLYYWDSYGNQIIISIIIICIFAGLNIYYYILNNIEPIKNDWINQRCNPIVMPFAGMINKPNNKTAFQFTSENFTYCTQNILKDYSGQTMKPFNFATNILSKFFLLLLTIMNNIRKMLNKIRIQLESIVKVIFSRILNIVISLQEFFVYLRDIFAKTVGILTSGFYVLLGSYFTLKSSIGALFEFIVIILFILIGMIIPLWVLPFTWGFAAFLTVVFLAIAIPLGIIAITMNQSMGLTLSGIPKAPKCFDSETKLNKQTTIKNVKVGEIINDNMITAKMKMSSKNEKLFNLNNIFVTGNHKLYINEKIINVSQHLDSKPVYNKKFELFCINTLKKKIDLNNISFCDYDELTCDEIQILKDNYILNVNKEPNNLDFIHEYYHGGFVEDTTIKLLNGSEKKIKDIDCDDVLEGFNRVYGVVEIKADNLYHKISHDKNNNIFASENLCITHLGKFKKIKHISEYEPLENPPVLYHLITETGYFLVNNVLFNDYNYLIECYL